TAQTRTYDYQISGSVANQKATGFVVKNTVSVHFKEKEWMDKVMSAAAKSNIYDLIKVDYLVNNTESVRERLLEECARIVKEKAGRYEKILGLKFRTQVQIAQENYDTIFPSDSYDSYIAYESGKVTESTFSDRNRVKEARKDETFFFNAQNEGNFDSIINPVVTEPVIQFSLYLQIRYLFDR
ncbi:MAG: SIMPL domain-containing protein, partial [Blastocatellia bacterium]|nr:SIMPL domain-containing protein [Blastocatellia bacterium]